MCSYYVLVFVCVCYMLISLLPFVGNEHELLLYCLSCNNLVYFFIRFYRFCSEFNLFIFTVIVIIIFIIILFMPNDEVEVNQKPTKKKAFRYHFLYCKHGYCILFYWILFFSWFSSRMFCFWLTMKRTFPIRPCFYGFVCVCFVFHFYFLLKRRGQTISSNRQTTDKPRDDVAGTWRRQNRKT